MDHYKSDYAINQIYFGCLSQDLARDALSIQTSAVSFDESNADVSYGGLRVPAAMHLLDYYPQVAC